MKITNIRTEENDTHITLLADCKIRPYGWDTVYFSFDKKYKDDLVLDASPLAAAFLIPAMVQGEELVVDGTISEKLYFGMRQLMETVADWKWHIKTKRINIKVENMVPDTGHPQHVATFFSGGVDSFYTFLKHQNDTTDKLDHFILIKGNDIELENQDLWNSTLESVSRIAEKSNIELVIVESNYQTIMEPMIDQGYTHGGLLAAVGLCMRNRFKKIYIPATFTRELDIKWGTHPDIDHMWGTETIAFQHDGEEATRYQKVDLQVARSPLALEELRVCYMNVKGTYNCGKCEKCYRTMVALLATGQLDKAKTFPHEFNLDFIKQIASESGSMFVTWDELLHALEARKISPDVQEAIKQGLAINDKNAPEGHGLLAKRLIRLDYLYLHGFLRGFWRKMKI